MGLRKRPIDPFKLVCIHDDALDAIPDRIMRAYEESNRDFAVLEPEILKLKVKPAVFVVDPLKPKYDSLAVSGVLSDIKAVFAAHVRAIDNAPPDMLPVFVERDETRHLASEYVDSLETAWISDIAGAIISKGLGADVSPFTLPVGFWRERTRRAVRRHASAVATIARSEETASAESTSNAG